MSKTQDTNAAPTDPSAALAHAERNLGESRKPTEQQSPSEKSLTDSQPANSGGA